MVKGGDIISTFLEQTFSIQILEDPDIYMTQRDQYCAEDLLSELKDVSVFFQIYIIILVCKRFLFIQIWVHRNIQLRQAETSISHQVNSQVLAELC